MNESSNLELYHIYMYLHVFVAYILTFGVVVFFFLNNLYVLT